MKSTPLRFTLFSVLMALQPFVYAAPAQSAKISTEAEIKEEIEQSPCDSKKRLEEAKKLFLKAGAKEEDISVEKFKQGENLRIKLKGGTGTGTIIVGAHYDKTDNGCGAIDNWSGIVIISNLYKSLSQFSPKKSYVFVAFDKEEKGLLGSKAMADSIPKGVLAQYCSMVNVDGFGLAATQAAANLSSPKMMKAAKDLAAEMQLRFGDAPLSGASSDSVSFLSKKIPAITFHGLSGNWKSILHSSSDKTAAVNTQRVYAGYRFILAYLMKADEAACSNFR